MFQDKDSTMTLLRARPNPPPSATARAPLRSAREARPPQFAVAWQKKYSGWWTSLKTLCTRVHLPPLKQSIVLFRNTPVAPFRFAGGPLLAAVFLHLAVFLLLPFLLSLPPGRDISSVAAYSEPEKIYYRVNMHDPFEKLPRIAPAGPGGHPGAGVPQLQLPMLGSTVSHQRIIIVSKPVRPDNHRQTIYQPATPPDLKITMDLKLPNIVGAASPKIPKPQIHFNPNDSKPTQAHKVTAKAAAPTLAAANSVAAMNLPIPTVAQPHLAVPINADSSRPVQWQGAMTKVTAPSLSAAAAATSLGESAIAQTGGPARPSEVLGEVEISGSGKAPSTTDSTVPASGNGTGVVIISVDPAQAASLANLPAGNRWGEFSISPGGGQPGSPGGSANGSPSGSAGASGAGGDRGTGVGTSELGGGGGKAAAPGTLSIAGTAGGKGENMLDPSIARDMVYAVPASVIPRRNALIVSAGPMGGGGLDAYGALHCGKIYTVFLPMPGKGWTLQFCQSGATPAKAPTQTYSSVVHLENGLIPPDAESRFDFKRLPVPFEKKNKMIVFQGSITADGTIEGLKIYQSIVPEMDEAARVALSRWKFKPAMREGKPVAVDILVGIPPEPPPGRAQ
jgi:Gram-negative bacterial TonB protein C-terminal